MIKPKQERPELGPQFNEDSAPRDAHIRVFLTGSGLCAVKRATFYEPDLGWYPDIWQHGVGRYQTYEEAAEEGRCWAERERIEFRE